MTQNGQGMGRDERGEHMGQARGEQRGNARGEERSERIGNRDRDRNQRMGDRDRDQRMGQRDRDQRLGNSDRDRGQGFREDRGDRQLGERGRGVREGRDEFREGRGGVTARLSSDQRTRIHERLFAEGGRAHRLGHVDFALRRGIRVPGSVEFYDLPEDIVTLVPAYRAYKYFLVGDEIVIVDPGTYEIVDVILA